MKILQICNKAPYPANDGSSIAIYNMANGLVDAGVELHLLTINTKKHFKSDDAVPIEFKNKTHYKSVYKNTDTSATGALLNLFSNQSYFISRFYFKEFEEQLIQLLNKIIFDIVQLEGLFMANYIPVIKKHSKAKIVLRAHNIEYLIWERHIAIEKNKLKKIYLRIQKERLKQFEIATFNKVDAIITITEADKKVIEKLALNTKTFTSITGVDVANYTLPATTKNHNSIFCFGAMDWMPNQEAVDWFLKYCWEKVKEANPNCIFVIAGRNMPEHYKNLKLKDVQVIENVSDNKQFYAQYNIMLVPLLSGSGLRIKIIEGMSFGKAIVSTSIGAEGVFAENGKEIILADTPNEFINAVNNLLSSPKQIELLESHAKNFAKLNFNNSEISNKLVAYYKTLVN